MSNPKYLSSALPTAEKPVKQTGGSADDDRIAALEARLEELNNLLIKQQRDEQDYRDNIDEQNLSESLMKKIQDLEARVTALEG
jgi:hypothetical protein